MPYHVGNAHYDSVIIPGYTFTMKTAISLPDDTFERVSRRAKDLGLSRSEFFARAANRYLEQLDAASVPKQINAALERLVETDESNEAAAQAGRQFLLDVSDEW